MIFKEFIGTTPVYVIRFFDKNGSIINIDTEAENYIVKIVIKLYNSITGELLYGWSGEEVKGYDTADFGGIWINDDNNSFRFDIPEEISNDLKEGVNRIEVWVYSFSSTYGKVSANCFSGLFNEFIDSQKPEVKWS